MPRSSGDQFREVFQVDGRTGEADHPVLGRLSVTQVILADRYRRVADIEGRSSVQCGFTTGGGHRLAEAHDVAKGEPHGEGAHSRHVDGFAHPGGDVEGIHEGHLQGLFDAPAVLGAGGGALGLGGGRSDRRHRSELQEEGCFLGSEFCAVEA